MNRNLEDLDAFSRQLRRFDIKVRGSNSDAVERFFANNNMITYNIDTEKICEAIQKQIPQSVVITTSTIRCPCCNKQITNKGCIKTHIRFCSKCGQALDWSKDE